PVLTPRRASAGLPSFRFAHPYCGGRHVPTQAQTPYRHAHRSHLPRCPRQPRRPARTDRRGLSRLLTHPAPPRRRRPSRPRPPPPALPDTTAAAADVAPSTGSRQARADRLSRHRDTTVAREATGVHWDPLLAIPQKRAFHVTLGPPSYTSGIKGRPKTGRLD